MSSVSGVLWILLDVFYGPLRTSDVGGLLKANSDDDDGVMSSFDR
jgi:hypothetical protein